MFRLRESALKSTIVSPSVLLIQRGLLRFTTVRENHCNLLAAV